jgi:hypothetical protein
MRYNDYATRQHLHVVFSCHYLLSDSLERGSPGGFSRRGFSMRKKFEKFEKSA